MGYQRWTRNGVAESAERTPHVFAEAESENLFVSGGAAEEKIDIFPNYFLQSSN